MNADLISLINFMKSHNAVYCLATAHIAKELLSFCFDNGLKIDAFVQPGDTKDGANFFGVPVYGENLVPLAQNCGWIAAVGDAGAAETFLKLQRSGIYDSFLVTESMVSEMVRLALLPNAKLKGAAESERCFLLCTGPSIKKLDLLKLKNEVVFSCNDGFCLPQYKDIAPKYHVMPSVENEMLGDEFNNDYGGFVDEKLTSKVIFRDYLDRVHLQSRDWLKDKNVFYLLQNLEWDVNSKNIPDLTGPTPIIWNVSVMMLKVALYMGFRKIYFLGVELDDFNKPYEHAYDADQYPENFRHLFVQAEDAHAACSM